MKYTAIIVSALLSIGVLGATADKLSPDTRLRLEQRSKMMNTNSTESEKPSMKVFISVEEGFDPMNLAIEGVEIQSVFNRIVTAAVTPEAIVRLCELDGVKYIQRAHKVNLCNDFGRRDLKVDQIHKNEGNELPQPYTGTGVVVGMIDTGVEYGHRSFYSTDGTELRIRRVWDMNGFGTPPEGFTYGKELKTESEILTATCDSRYDYHGSHTMGTAAGGGNLPTKYYGMAPDADIVFVSFKTDDNSAIADGIKYIFDYADEVGKPCVINMSLGSHQGPHDGTSYVDQIIDEMSGPGRIIVGAAGNEGEARMHASKTFTAGSKTLKTLLTYNSGQSHKLHYLDIWGTPGSNFTVKMSIFDSLKGRALYSSDAFDTANPDKNVYYFTYLDEEGADMDCVITGEINPENGAPHVYIEASMGDLGTGRMPGLTITGEAGATVNLWNVGQHEFSSNNIASLTNGDNNMTVGEIGGTANRIITVGSYDGRDTVYFTHGNYYALTETAISSYKKHQHSVFSSYGPTADGRTVPHILAPGMPVISTFNRYAMDATMLDQETCDYTTDASGRKYYYMYSMGTSMAAPHVAGSIALMLQANPELTPEQARQIIQETAVTSSEMGTLPNNTWGAGRLNTLECVKRAVSLNDVQSITDVDVDNESTQAWGENGNIIVSTPAVGSKVRIYNLSGLLLKEATLTESFTTIDALAWGHGIFVAEVVGSNSRSSFKIAL